MNTETKLIKTKLGLLKLAEKLGNVFQACKVMGYPVIVFTASKSCTIQAVNQPCMRSAIVSQYLRTV